MCPFSSVTDTPCIREEKSQQQSHGSTEALVWQTWVLAEGEKQTPSWCQERHKASAAGASAAPCSPSHNQGQLLQALGLSPITGCTRDVPKTAGRNCLPCRELRPRPHLHPPADAWKGSWGCGVNLFSSACSLSLAAGRPVAIWGTCRGRFGVVFLQLSPRCPPLLRSAGAGRELWKQAEPL